MAHPIFVHGHSQTLLPVSESPSISTCFVLLKILAPQGQQESLNKYCLCNLCAWVSLSDQNLCTHLPHSYYLRYTAIEVHSIICAPGSPCLIRIRVQVYHLSTARDLARTGGQGCQPRCVRESEQPPRYVICEFKQPWRCVVRQLSRCLREFRRRTRWSDG